MIAYVGVLYSTHDAGRTRNAGHKREPMGGILQGSHQWLCPWEQIKEVLNCQRVWSQAKLMVTLAENISLLLSRLGEFTK